MRNEAALKAVPLTRVALEVRPEEVAGVEGEVARIIADHIAGTDSWPAEKRALYVQELADNFTRYGSSVFFPFWREVPRSLAVFRSGHEVFVSAAEVLAQPAVSVVDEVEAYFSWEGLRGTGHLKSGVRHASTSHCFLRGFPGPSLRGFHEILASGLSLTVIERHGPWVIEQWAPRQQVGYDRFQPVTPGEIRGFGDRVVAVSSRSTYGVLLNGGHPLSRWLVAVRDLVGEQDPRWKAINEAFRPRPSEQVRINALNAIVAAAGDQSKFGLKLSDVRQIHSWGSRSSLLCDCENGLGDHGSVRGAARVPSRPRRPGR